jgi:glycosyltransferase involved in cell wall biosynthesis
VDAATDIATDGRDGSAARPLAGEAALSVVVPVFNEAPNVAELLRRLTAVLAPLGIDHEILLVDDGSQDETWAGIAAAAARDKAVRGLRLSRNFGHQNALFAGLGRARGRVVISLDGDLQHPPELIPELIRQWESGFDIVHTRRLDNRQTGFIKRHTSKYFYAIFSLLAEVSLSEGSCEFRLLDRQALDALLQLRDPEPFLRGAVQWLGFRATTVPFRPALRQAGTSKYGLRKLFGLATGAILSYSTRLLHLGIWIGLLTSLFAFIELIGALVDYVEGNTVRGWTATIGVMLLLFGVLFVLLGIIGLYLARIHRTLQSRPLYIVADSIEAGAPPPAPHAPRRLGAEGG